METLLGCFCYRIGSGEKYFPFTAKIVLASSKHASILEAIKHPVVDAVLPRNGAPDMQTPSTLSIWLSEQAWPLAIIFLILAFVMITLYVSARNRRVRMNEARSGVNEDTFIDMMDADGFDRNLARETYRYLQEKQNVSFPIHATDHLDEELGLDSEDVEESIQDLLARTERLYQPGLKHMPIVTVEDLVRFLQASPRLSELAA